MAPSKDATSVLVKTAGMRLAPAHVKANPVEVGLLGFEAIVFVTKYLTPLIQQALGLGGISDGIHNIKTMYKKQY